MKLSDCDHGPFKKYVKKHSRADQGICREVALKLWSSHLSHRDELYLFCICVSNGFFCRLEIPHIIHRLLLLLTPGDSLSCILLCDINVGKQSNKMKDEL